MKMQTPWDAAEEAMREKWSAGRWIAAVVVLVVGIAANALLRLL